MLIIGIVCISYVFPKYKEDQIRQKAPKFLEINGLKIIKEGEFNSFSNEVEYTVKKDTIIYDISVKLIRDGALSIITK